nr:mediator of RNA polymerase II transcription subunit 1 [Parasteatoda tepidariorum]
MEKLKSKAGQYRSWMEMSKSLRVAVTEKRHLMNASDRSQLQKVLDTLQKSIKVTSLRSMIERLESISRQVQGVKFSNRYPTPELYLFNDMFYVEILLENSGAVKDVKINHQADQASTTCPELVKVLKAGNFSEFTKHMEGLASIYQLNAEKMQKSQAFLALQALETDLGKLAQLKSSSTEPRNLVHNSAVGILQNRRGGYSLKLTYFISPYDLLDVETKASIPLTIETVIEKGLGQSVTVCIESSTAHKLQTTSLITVTKTADGRSQPQFAALSNLNSTILPAHFVLKLPKPIPMATSLVKDIQSVTNAKIPDCGDLSNALPLLSVIINDASSGKLSAGDQGLWVTLPDQHHCYFLNSSSDLQGVMVSSIPFTHPTHVPQILVFLRQQMLFNTVISSCIRPSSKKDAESPFMFEGMAYSTSHILVSFEHPLEESLATVDIDLKDLNKVSCKIYTLSSDATMCTDEYASKVMQRCLSIPITMRAVIRKAQGQQQLMRSSSQGDAYGATVGGSGSVPYLSHLPNYGNSLTNGSSFPGGDFSNLASRMCNKPSDNVSTTKASKNGAGNQAPENPSLSQSNADNPPLKMETDPAQSNSADNFNSDKSKNSVNGSSNPYQQRRQANTMLMSMLSDVPAANPSSASFPFLSQGENSPNIPGKSRKRKKKSENRSPGSSAGRSPKRKLSEDDYVRDRSTPDGEICDSPLAYEACSSLPASLPSTPAEQQLTHRIGSVESFIKTEPGASPGFPQRSASTDSYLMHEEFQPRESLNVNDSSRLSEGGTPTNLEIVRNFSQVKTQYFGSDNLLEMKPFLGPSDTSYGGAVAISSDIDMDDDNAYSMESSQSNVVSSKSSDKQFKKKKYKEKSDITESGEVGKGHDNSSDESSIGDLSQKSFSETENSQSEDLSLSAKSSSSHSSQLVFLGTSLKIAKSGDGHKVSKSETKVKLKESKKSSESSDKKKSDAKKERKRKRAENSGSSSGRSPVRPLHLNIDSSLMPPPSSTSDSSSIVSSAETQPIRPITLNVKTAPSLSSSSNFQSKSPVYSKKSLSNSPSSKNSSLKISSEKSIKPSPPRTNFPLKVSSSDPDSKKGNPTLKIPSKHKQSSSGKSSSSSTSHSSGRSSPSKPKSATIKLKNVMPSAVTISPIISKVSSAVPSNDALVMQATILNPGSPSGKSGSNNSKANKSALRSRKCSLSAVIDKLKVNAQFSSVDGLENPKCDAMRSDALVDRKESKLERKDNSKDSSLISKVSEKSKYSSSEQFTVKQSSGIKLTVTKTRASDGSSKSSKSKQSNKSSSVLSSSSLSNVSKSSSSNPSKCGNVSPASKKIYSSAQTNLGTSSKISNLSSGNPLKQNQQTSQKISSPSSALSPRTSSSGNTINKSLSKHVSSSSQSKTSGSMSKTQDKSDKKSFGDLKPSQNENKEMFPSSALNLMPPPVSKSSSDTCRISSSGSTPKRVDEGSRQSPRHTPTREILIDDMESDRPYRHPSSQSKTDSLLSEQITSSKGPQMILPTPVDYCKVEIIKPDIDDKVQWIPNSSDIKSSSAPSSTTKMEDVNCLNLNDIDCKLNSQVEISSSNKYENMMNLNMIPSSEDHGKSSAPLLKSLKQVKRPMERGGDDSSPEECLVIDCGSNEKWSSPCIDNSIILSVLEDEKPEKSPNTFLLNQPSLTKSPVQVLTPNHSLRPLSYAIDDDLMNEAVRPLEK